MKSQDSAQKLFRFDSIFQPTFSYLDEDLMMEFLAQGEGPSNVFNFMMLDNLIEILQRAEVGKDVKMLAIQRYLDASPKTKVSGG